MRSVGMNDIIIEFINQFADLKAGRQVNFSPHRNWENVYADPGRPFFDQGASLAYQMSGYLAFIEACQQIKGLLLPAPPCTLGVYM